MSQSSDLLFSLDSSLGRFARWLRLLGHDAAWTRGDTLRIALARAHTEGRILLTRSTEVGRFGLSLPPRGAVFIRSGNVLDQLIELGKVQPIFPTAEPFARCAVCNVGLQAIEAEEVSHRIPPFVAKTQTSFRICPSCQRIFWPASHTQEILKVFEKAAQAVGQSIGPGAERESAESESSDSAPPQA